ncbi:MAG: hypothetical protein ACQEUB_13350 [Thermodesulfobacteriota bacterium]
MPSPSELTTHIVEKAKALGASVAGVADVGPLLESPSHLLYPKIGMDLSAHWQDRQEDMEICEVAWPKDAVSAVVIGNESSSWVKYCRTCELSCPVGKDI